MNADRPGPNEDAGPPSVTFASGGLSWTRVRTPRLLSRIAKVLYASGALQVLGTPSFGTGLLFIVPALLSALAWPLFILSYILSLTQTAFPGSLEVSNEELVLHTGTKRQSFARAKIAGALVVEREMFGSFVPTVEIELTNGNILTARLPDPRSAHAVVRALGFGAGGKRVHAGLAKPTRRLFHPLIAMFAYVVGMASMIFVDGLVKSASGLPLGYALSPVVALSVYALFTRLLRAPEVTVGDDGVLVKRMLRSRFIPRSEISSVSAEAGTALVIEKHDRERIVVGGLVLDPARRSAIGRVIEERVGPSAAATDRFAHYERAGRPLAAWREHLAGAMDQASYRQNAATVDEADAVLRSAQATPEQRVGAALALRIAGQPAARIRVAVDGAVDERVREALEAVAESDDDAVLEKALRRLVV